MNSTLEHNDSPVFSIGQLAFFRDQRTDGIPNLVSKGETLTICAWCDPDKRLTRAMKSFYAVSHGICESCNGKVLAGSG